MYPRLSSCNNRIHHCQTTLSCQNCKQLDLCTLHNLKSRFPHNCMLRLECPCSRNHKSHRDRRRHRTRLERCHRSRMLRLGCPCSHTHKWRPGHHRHHIHPKRCHRSHIHLRECHSIRIHRSPRVPHKRRTHLQRCHHNRKQSQLPQTTHSNCSCRFRCPSIRFELSLSTPLILPSHWKPNQVHSYRILGSL